MKNSVKGLVRVRPQVPREIESGQPILVQMDDEHTTTLLGNISTGNTAAQASPSKTKEKEQRSFQFDHSLWSANPQDPHFKSQKDTYEIIGQEILEHTLDGYNTCIFAYGQTSSGKTYTMMGGEDDPEEWGIIPRCCSEIFQRVEAMDDVKVSIKVSFFEIYNESVRDLLNENKSLKVRENPQKGPYVDGLQEFNVVSYEELQKFMAMGNRNRTVGSTKMNESSSRSHSIFTVNVKIMEFDNDEILREKNSSLRLVDLAGSERVNSTGSKGLRLKEGTNINKSLTTLGRVISALTENTKPPYRDSTLTWILKESLGGNSKTAMIACISPSDYDETLSTLRYATLVKKVKLNAVINIETNKEREDFVRMQNEIESLQSSLQQMQQQDGLMSKFSNMNRFFEDRLMETNDKYELVQEKLIKTMNDKTRLERDLHSMLMSVSSNVNQFNEIEKDYARILNKSSDFQSQLQKDLELFAP